MVLRAFVHFTSCVGRLLAPVFVVMSLVAVAVPADAQSFRFNSFDVQGNFRTNDASVLQVAGLSSGSTVSAGQVNDALQRLQNSGLFESVEVAPRGNTLVITVVEYPTINRIAIEGNRRLDDDDLLVLLESTPRRVFSPITAERDAAAIAEAYRVTGRLTATATPQIIRRDENRVDLVFEVSEGAVVETQRIAFVGNRDYSDRRLRQILEGVWRYTRVRRGTAVVTEGAASSWLRRHRSVCLPDVLPSSFRRAIRPSGRRSALAIDLFHHADQSPPRSPRSLAAEARNGSRAAHRCGGGWRNGSFGKS